MSTVNIKRGSTTHVALMYLKIKRSMKKSWASVDDLFALTPIKYKKRYKAQNALDLLVKHELAICKDDLYHITDKGVKILTRIIADQTYAYAD